MVAVPPKNHEIGFLVTMPGVVTMDLWWLLATEAIRAEAVRQLARVAVGVYTLQVRAGIGRDGKRLEGLKPYTIEHRRSASGHVDRYAPPFIPGHDDSRVLANLRAKIQPNGVWFYWREGFGIILDYHRKGMVPNAPIRDVIGLSPQAEARLTAEMERWWKGITKPETTNGNGHFGYGPKINTGKPKPKPINIGADLDTFTFHTGDRQRVEEMVANGTFSGFRREVGGAPTFVGQPRRPKPPATRAIGPRLKPVAPKPAISKPAPAVAKQFAPDDPDAMTDWTQEAFGAWGKSLTRHEKEAIDRYSSHVYKKVNSVLRGDSSMPRRDKQKARRIVAQVDAAIEKGTVPESIVVWRGVSARRLGAADLADLRPGTILEEKAFSSVSLSRAVAEDADFAKGAVLKIHVPAGTHAASTQVAAGFAREFELILPRGGRVLVTSVTRTDRGYLIEGEWLAGGPSR